MYARPELEEANEAYWQTIRKTLDKRGIASPASLSNDAPEFEVWQAPDLVLSQTCGLPYRAKLADHVTLVGTPDFGLQDCPPGYYNSAVIVRADDTRGTLSAFETANFAYNQGLSQSGFAAIHTLAISEGFWFQNRTETGGHRASAQLIAAGGADIAAVDAQTWRLICRFDDFANDLRILQWTNPTPGLPYITAIDQNGDAVFEAVSEAIEMLPTEVRDALDLKGLVRIPRETYLAMPNPPPEAST